MVEEDASADGLPRLRSDTELDAQARGLSDLCDGLTDAGIPYLLSGGTLLGAARDGDFIRWDWDVEVSVRSEDLDGHMDDVVGRMAARGFSVRERDDADDNLKLVLERDGAVYELQGYRRRGERRIRRNYVTQDRYFVSSGTIGLRGRDYPCMGPLDEYLTDRYGDWRTPKRTADKSEYLRAGYFRRPAWWRRGVGLGRAALRRLASVPRAGSRARHRS